MDVLYLGQVYVKAGSVEPFFTGIASNHFNSFRLVTNAVRVLTLAEATACLTLELLSPLSNSGSSVDSEDFHPAHKTPLLLAGLRD